MKADRRVFRLLRLILRKQQMEAFKAYEREAKTKAFSKEGLARQREKEMKGEDGGRDITEWLQDRIEELKRQIEVLEGEIESEASKKKKGSTEASETRLERHKFHLDGLEKLLRMWENEAIERDQIENVKDDIDYYVDNNQDDDFMENETIYDELGLDDWNPEDIDHEYGDYEPEDVDEMHLDEAGLSTSADGESTGGVSETSSTTSSSAIGTQPGGISSSDAEVTKKAFDESSSTSLSSSAAAAIGSQILDAAPGGRGAVGSSVSGSAAVGGSAVGGPSAIGPVSSSSPQSQAAHLLDPQVPTGNFTSLAGSSSLIQPPHDVGASASSVATLGGPSGLSSSAAMGGGGASGNVASAPATFQPSATVGVPRFAGASRSAEAELLEMAGLKASARYLPEPEPTRMPYKARNPAATPSSYPSTPAQNLLDDPATFGKFPPDLLFFLFYFQQNTYQQYLAARELKRQSWRYHTKYLTWFQRHEDPKTINPEYEQGTYVYFDYETGWCQRKKSEFTFQYVFLEDNDLP